MSNKHRLPIILAHGIARFDFLAVMLMETLGLPDNRFTDRFQYFKGIKTLLEAAENGFKVFHPNQDFAGSVDLRAEQLRDRVKEVMESEGVSKVHIIAHSMGGLDARHMIVDKGMAEHVASLTTIGTPHLGTSFAGLADTAAGKLAIQLLRPFINIDGFRDLTIKACNAFNLRAENDEAKNGVFYQTYASKETRDSIFAPLKKAFDFIQREEGDNDGLVPFQSQQWKSELVANDGSRKPVAQKSFPVPADHLNEVGWWDPEERMDLTLDIPAVLRRAREYEDSIKAVYLEIAENLPE